jgi:hypothetical protein
MTATQDTGWPEWTDLLDAMAVDLPEAEQDGLKLERFVIPENDIGNMIIGLKSGRSARPGTYTKLTIGGRLWMSDTTAERRDHFEPLLKIWRHRARRVVINGLGLGMIVKAALAVPSVEHIDVVEADARVAALVGPHYAATGRVTVHVADAYEQARRWSTGTRWDVGWSDIWPDLCEANLPGMARLNRSYGRRCDWHGCWGQAAIKAHMRRHGW